MSSLPKATRMQRVVVALLAALVATLVATRPALAATERPVMVVAAKGSDARAAPVKVTIQKRHQLWTGYFSSNVTYWSGKLQPGAVYRFKSAGTSRYEGKTFYFKPSRRGNTYCLSVEMNYSLRWRGMAWPAYYEYYIGRNRYTKYGYRDCGYATLAAALR